MATIVYLWSDVAPLNIVYVHLNYFNIMMCVYGAVDFSLEPPRVFSSTVRDPHLSEGVELYIVSLYIAPWSSLYILVMCDHCAHFGYSFLVPLSCLSHLSCSLLHYSNRHAYLPCRIHV